MEKNEIAADPKTRSLVLALMSASSIVVWFDVQLAIYLAIASFWFKPERKLSEELKLAQESGSK